VADDEAGGGFAQIGERLQPGALELSGGLAYGPMIEALRRFLDQVAAAAPDAATLRELAQDLEAWSARLEPLAVPEDGQFFGRRPDLPGRGQTLWPGAVILESDAERFRGKVTFGRYFLGGNGAAHGGAIPLLFDELLGRFANTGGRSRARTGYLRVDYRSITPIGAELEIRGWFAKEEGRKRLMRGELWHGETLCAEAEGLFVTLKPGQP